MHIIAYVVAFAVLLAAGAILFLRVREFFRTGGRSACKNCPFAGDCSKEGCSSNRRPTEP